MRLSVPLAVIAFATVLAAQTERFTVAMVRQDGALVPFASVDGGVWQRAWPAADEHTDPPAAFGDIPSIWRARGGSVPAVWHIFAIPPRAPTRARVTGVELVEAHCSKQVALTTDLTPIQTDQPGKIGIAVDVPGVPVTRIERLPRSGRLWTSAERIIQDSFSSLERAQAQRQGERLPSESPEPRPQVAALYGTADSDQPVMYVVAERRYRSARSINDPTCNQVTMVTAWLLPTDRKYTVVNPSVFLTNCDAKEVRRAVPLGSVNVAGRLFWIMQVHGYESETYVVAEIEQHAVRYHIEVNGGGC